MTCGVHADGCAECWGADFDDVRDTASWYRDFGVYAVPDASMVTIFPEQYELGSDRHNHYACGIRTDGFAQCWGELDLVSPDTYQSLIVDQSQICGVLASYGSRCFGGLWGESASIQRPDVKSMAYGINITALLNLDGTIWAELDGLDGAAIVNLGTPPYTKIAAMGVDICALDAQSRLSCWNATDLQPDDPMVTEAPRSGAWTAVCLTYEGNGCALDESGYPTCWGARPMGEPVEQLAQLSCGRAEACGVTTDGRILCWGECAYGECTPPS